MRHGFIAAALVAVTISGVVLAAVESRRPSTVVATEAPISIPKLTLKAPRLPMEVEEFTFAYIK